MFKTWNVLDCGLRGISDGHHYWEAKALAGELKRRGVATQIFCYKGGPAPEIPDAQVFPVFPFFLMEAISRDLNWGYAENFFAHNRVFLNALAGIEHSAFLSSLVLIPNMTERQMLGTIRWLGSFNDRERPKTIMQLEPAKGGASEKAVLSAYKKIWTHCPPEVKRDIHLCAREPLLAEGFRGAFGFAPTVLPQSTELPDAVNLTKRETMTARPMTVSFVGGARRERGVGLLPEIVEKCAAKDVRFVVQVRPGADPGFDNGLLSGLQGRENVELHRGVMPTEEYYGAIANSVVLLAYNASRYQRRSSGVYLEAKSLGAPVIVSPGNWMAEEVRSVGNGIVCEEYSADAIVEAIENAMRQIDDLRTRAAAIAGNFREQQGVVRFVDSVLGLMSEASA